MPRVTILTDSTADLGPELVARYNLTVLPLLVEFDGETYQDGVDIDPRRLFALVKAGGRLPRTSSINPETYREAFARATTGGGQAIYIGLSSQLSSTLQNARLAAAMFPEGQVRVFDSANLSTGIGLLVLHAAELAQQGQSADAIISALEAARPKVRTLFMIDTLDYLHMGGRCSGVQALVGSLLKLRPVISVVEGGMVVAAKLRGARQKGLDWMLEQFAQEARQGLVQPDRVFITHTGVGTDAQYMAERVRQILPGVREVLETQAGAVISSHCGPGTIGILYMTR